MKNPGQCVCRVPQLIGMYRSRLANAEYLEVPFKEKIHDREHIFFNATFPWIDIKTHARSRIKD
jgi:hypothetical protein